MKKLIVIITGLLFISCDPQEGNKEHYPGQIEVITVQGDTAIIKDLGNTTHGIEIKNK